MKMRLSDRAGLEERADDGRELKSEQVLSHAQRLNASLTARIEVQCDGTETLDIRMTRRCVKRTEGRLYRHLKEMAPREYQYTNFSHRKAGFPVDVVLIPASWMPLENECKRKRNHWISNIRFMHKVLMINDQSQFYLRRGRFFSCR